MIACAKPNPELVPLCILSGYREHLALRRQGCIETWIPHLDRKFCPVFVTGDPKLDRPWHFDPPFLIVRCGDHYPQLPSKVRGFCQWALENFNLRWLFKCDDDSYINTRLFNPFPFENWDWVGHFYGQGELWKAHGAGYSLSRRCVEAVAEHMPPSGSEDWEASLLIRKHVPDFRHMDLAWTAPTIAPWSGEDMRSEWMIGHRINGICAQHRAHERVFRP